MELNKDKIVQDETATNHEAVPDGMDAS